jgi:type I restriction enzyme R subunit
MTNFEFLKYEFPSLFKKLEKAERRAKSEPVSTAFYCRKALEESIHLIYDFHYLNLPYNTTISSLMGESDIKRIIPPNLITGLHIIRKTGNDGVHFSKKNRVSSQQAVVSLRYLYDFLKWFAYKYAVEIPELPDAFEESFIPKIGAEKQQIRQLEKEHEAAQKARDAEIEKLKAKIAEAEAKAAESEEALTNYQSKITEAKAITEAKFEARVAPISSEFTEAETRIHLIDAALREAGWNKLRDGYELEYPVKGMPITPDNPKGNGFVDYVLWDDNGKPLALIEAKRTSKSVEVGRHQAFLYANCLEKMHDQRPIIFYTNGFETMIWDDVFYSTPRRVYGFHTKDELQWAIQQRATRKDIRQAKVNEEIAGRPYQMEAIQRVAESFVTEGENGLKGKKREVLLVMATGSGKTRTSAALVDILFKFNWIKRVLFLADRNALVRQAKRNYGDYLPDLSSIDLSAEKENDTTRLVFSTYPSMLNKIDGIRTDDERFYGIGHFDLIIVDEAHRSVYNRYKAIFEYFDALIVGLTATPKDSIDHNTFELFGCSDDDPTFSYELDEAVPVYLKDYQAQDVSTEFLREGIRYSLLSAKEKAKYEDTFRDATTGLFPEHIRANAMNKWLFNKDTVNKVLDTLMEEGLKIEGGDKIGRTIVFAVNQSHAKFIVDCFTKRYPEKPSGFISMIHNKVSHAQSLIDAFCDEHNENLPQIAVSVDMMDTGIDAPRVLNLVFFKVVRSYAKFWQMIGRGTRLCPDVFGPKQPKEYFKIFDVCQNFDFFEINRRGRDSVGMRPISQQIFEARLQLSRLLAETGNEENLELTSKLLDILHQSIQNLDRNRFQVNMNLRYVEEFKERERWNNLTADDVHLIETYLSKLPVPELSDEGARRFDLMMLKLQIADLLQLGTQGNYQENLSIIADALSRKYTIPSVLHAQKTIEQLKDHKFVTELTQRQMESIRAEIRELIKYLEQKNKEPIYTDIKDSDVTLQSREPAVAYTGSIYKKRVESFIRENKSQITISKLLNNKPITSQELEQLENILFADEERGTKEHFINAFGKQPLGEFVRSILGLDTAAAQQAFAEFLQVGNLRADQMTFLNNIITYLTKNGMIDKAMLFQSPFTDVHDQGLFGVFDDAEAGRIIRIIDEINGNADVA